MYDGIARRLMLALNPKKVYVSDVLWTLAQTAGDASCPGLDCAFVRAPGKRYTILPTIACICAHCPEELALATLYPWTDVENRAEATSALNIPALADDPRAAEPALARLRRIAERANVDHH